MKARFSYPLAFLLPCAMLASIAAIVSVAVGAGVAWLFIYGDNSWPDAAERTIMTLSAVVALTSFTALISASYFYGKRRESLGGLSKWHVTVAVASAILLPALVLCRHYQIGALGP
jgi:hypothetical protein